jgi:hypothetical protein
MRIKLTLILELPEPIPTEQIIEEIRECIEYEQSWSSNNIIKEIVIGDINQ